MSQLCNSTADEGADKNHPLRFVNGSGSFKLDKSKPNLKFSSKLIDLPNQETAQKMKLAQNVEENLQDMNKELDVLMEAEKKELLEKEPSNKRAVGRMSTGEIKKEPMVKRARSSPGSRASFNRTRSVSPPKDEGLPDFDREKFTPGYVPKTVQKGDQEYHIVLSGVPNTGLCGKYWGDGSLPSCRRKPTAKKSTPSMDVEKRATVKNNSSSVDVEKPSTLTKTPKLTAKRITSSVDVENPSVFAASPKTNTKKNSFSVDVDKSSTSTVTPKTTAESTPVNVEKSPSLEPERSFKKMADTTPGDMPGGGRKKKPEQVQVEETPQLKRTAMAPDLKGSKAEKIPEVASPAAKGSRMLEQIKDFNKKGSKEIPENNGKATGKERETLNSRCGTDVGVFEQNTNGRAIAPTEDSVNNKDVETNVKTASNTDNIVEQETVDMTIKQEEPTYDEEGEIQIIKEIVKTRATVMNIKQEKSPYQPKVIYTLVNENTEKGNQSLTEKGNQSLMQPNKEVSGHEQICVSKETQVSTCTNKYPPGTSAAFPTKYPSGMSALLANPPGTSAFPAKYPPGMSVLPASPPGTSAFPTKYPPGMSALPTNPPGMSAFPAKYPPGMSAFPAKYTPETSALPANFQLLKDQTKRKLDLLSQSGITITPHGPSEAKSFSTSFEARETTGLIHVAAARSPGDMTGHIQDGDTTASQGNSPGNNGSGDANECVNCGATDQRTNCGATHQRTRSQGNITVKIGGGDLTLNTGRLTAQMKISDVNITGPADDVANFVTKLSNVVLPRINE